jgi:hypothetical protein
MRSDQDSFQDRIIHTGSRRRLRPPILNSHERIVIEIAVRVEDDGVQDHIDERLPYSESDQLAHR